jgi:hypothetical protein
VRRSEWIEKAIRNGLNDREAAVAANLAQEAGARWEPEPEPAAEMPAEAMAVLREETALLRGSCRVDVVDDLIHDIAARLAPLWPRQQPAGPARERKLAVPVLMHYRGVGGGDALVYDVEPAGGEKFRVRIDPAGEDVLHELVGSYNLATPPAPAGWPAPRLGREGLPAKGLVLWWNTVEWAWLHVGCIEPNDRWLPGPPPPPEAP